jgi:4-hydroxythreonine-4-phosphate dehydrogenase
MNRFVFTCGDVNGIGPEIAIKAINKITSGSKKTQSILIIPENVFHNTKKFIKPKFSYELLENIDPDGSSEKQVQILALKSSPQQLGKPTVSSGKTSYLALQKSFELLNKKIASAVVTAPVSKTALKLAGSKYPGQTEMYADWCGVKDFVMTFLSKQLLVGLYSIHISLNEVSKSLNKKELNSKLKVINSMLKQDLGIKRPQIAVLGLNPHAGEGGLFGTEEKSVIEPVLKLQKYGSIVEGPFSSDAFFAKKKFKDYDMVFGFYHDQVLIPFKYINAGKGVNYTAGLPIIRTSPDHGVAFDIAGKGIADESSMLQAYQYAKKILKNRSKSKFDK